MVTYGFTGRAEGDMRGHKALSDFLTSKYPRITTVARPRQVHGNRIEIITSHTSDERLISLAETDGIITGLANCALTIITADCVPLVFYDEKAQVIGASHQGWKGTLARLPELMIQKMLSLGCHPQDIRVSVGPSISSCCYEIPHDRAISFRKEFPTTDALYSHGSHISLNLAQLCHEQLLSTGVSLENISYTVSCTSCQLDKYYSYRRASDKEQFEEQLSYIVQW